MSADVSERGDCHNLVFSVQIGLEREAVTVALGGSAEFTMSTLTEIACAFVDRKVSVVLNDCWIISLQKSDREWRCVEYKREDYQNFVLYCTAYHNGAQ